LIRTRGLAFRYPSAPALAFPDVDVPQGGSLLVQGRSGSGKSTWLALAAGLLSPAAGQVIVAGQDVAQLKRSERDRWRGRNIGFLPQRLHLSDALSVEGNLALASFAAGLPLDRQAMLAALRALDVSTLARRKPGELSGGEAQRVALARAILLQPKVLLADEPTASLDDEAAAAAMDLLQHAAQRCGATLVVATHDARARSALQGAQVLQLETMASTP
jgi:putative ABC transport system ATP-binding protein